MAAWSEHIASDPEILGGKPVVRGTRLAVDFVLSLFASGWAREQVLENYPSLTAESLKAVLRAARTGDPLEPMPMSGRRRSGA